MRTTVTLDADTEASVRALMVHRGISFKQALNDAIRAGTTPRADVGFTTVVHDMGAPVVNLDRALQIAGELEDEGAEQMLRSGR